MAASERLDEGVEAFALEGFTMCRKVAFLVLVLSGFAASGSHAAQIVGIGANLGYSRYMSDDADDISVLGWPSGANFTALTQPGLRVTFRGEQGMDEVFLDTALSVVFLSGESVTLFAGTLNYQRNFVPPGGTAPYVTVGVGVSLFNSDFAESSNPTFGGGVGLRRAVADGGGSIRGEVRVDRMFEDDEGFDALTVVSLKFGFDLWMD